MEKKKIVWNLWEKERYDYRSDAQSPSNERELRERWTLIYDDRWNSSFPIDFFFVWLYLFLYTIYKKMGYIRSIMIIKKIANNCRCRCLRGPCVSIERSCCLQREAVGHLTASLHHQLPPPSRLGGSLIKSKSSYTTTR